MFEPERLPQPDGQGFFSHPDIPDTGETAGPLIGALREAGFETEFVAMFGDAPEALCDAYSESTDLTAPSRWTPTPPQGWHWHLVAKYDTEDGPYAMFVRPIPGAWLMKYRQPAAVGLTILWRSFQALVVIPSTIVGGVLMMMAISGHDPARAAVIEFHESAQSAVCPAPAGTILGAKCVPPAAQSTDQRPLALCAETQMEPVPLDDAAAAFSRVIGTSYLIMVALSLGMMMMLYRSRQHFFGLPLKEAQPTDE